MAEPLTSEQLNQALIDFTAPIPGMEDTNMRYVGNDNLGYYPCMPDGGILQNQYGNYIVLPTMAHLRAWTVNFILQKQRQASGIVIPQGKIPHSRKN